MDSLTTFDPSETSGFITINAIRLKKVSLLLRPFGAEMLARSCVGIGANFFLQYGLQLSEAGIEL